MMEDKVREELLKMLYRIDVFSILLGPSIHQAYILGSKINDIVSRLRMCGAKEIPSKQGLKMALGQAEREADRLSKLCNVIEEDFLRELDFKGEITPERFGNDVLISANQNLYLIILIHNACIADKDNMLKIESMLKAMANKPNNPSYIKHDLLQEFNMQ